MEVNDELVDQIAELAKLKFEGPAKEGIKKDLNKMLDFIEKLNELDTENIEPLVYLSDEITVLREDIAEETITQKEALKNAPKKDSDYFKVPKVLGEK